LTAKKDRRIFILALLLASASAFLAYGLLASRPQAAPVIVEAAEPSGEPVLVAARSIEKGEELAASDVEIVYVPVEAKGERVLTEPAQAVGDVALAAISKGEQILASSVGEAIAAGPETFAGEVPVGMRAVSIAMEETVGAGGLVQPGDRVDVISSYELEPTHPTRTIEQALGLEPMPPAPEGDTGSDADADSGTETDIDGDGEPEEDEDAFPVAELLLQDVEVLAIGQALDPAADVAPPANPDTAATETETEPEAESGPAPRPDAASVTLLVNPSQALKLLLAVEADGMFRLLLRAPGDATITDLPPALITSGAVQMDPFELVGANLAPTDLVITEARFRQTSVPAGGMLEFEATARNVSSRLIPAGRGGAAPGHEYRAGQTWQSLAESAPAGVFSIGVTSEAAQTQTFPWRWDLGQDLAPGETATITGGIQAPNVPGIQRWWFGTLLQPGTVLADGVAPVEITIEPAESVVVVASEIDFRESPWPSAESVLQAPRGTRADVLEYQDGWFHVNAEGRDGWVQESAVVNAVLPESVAAQSETEATTVNVATETGETAHE
jgi:Flp pilus assembly protein CpaB